MTFPKFSIILSLFTAVFWGATYLLKTQILSEHSFFFETYQVIGFLWASTLIVYGSIKLINHFFFDKTGFAFLGFGIIKMAFSLVFLWPMIQDVNTDATYDTLIFFGLYFLYLFIETYAVVVLLKGK